MSKDTSGPAFPPFHDPKSHQSGMTLRDWFAGQALAGIMQNKLLYDYPLEVAEIANAVADAMIEVRK